MKVKPFLAGLVALVGAIYLEAANVDVPPRPINTPNPNFFGLIIGSDSFVSLEIEIDERGNVSNAIVRNSSHHTLEKPTLRAVRKWEFEPAYRNGKPVASKIIQPLTFGSSLLRSIDEKAIPLYSPKPELKQKLQEVEGEVGVAVSIDSAGFVTRVKVLYSNDQRLNLPILKALRQWQYEPAKRDGRAVSSKQIQPFTFGAKTKYDGKEVLNAAANSISVNPINEPPASLAKMDRESE
ncbi:MAG: energy transducer TonB [Verrucomicrobiae bacterium]|nr:energy transducer TonB [Verrucomicrobiae bacterium]